MKVSKTDDYLNLITKSLTYLYKDDKTCPGITISNLRNGDFYISLSRYDGAFARSRRIIFKDRSNNLENLLEKTAKFIVSQEKGDDPVSQLQKILAQSQKNHFTKAVDDDGVSFANWDDRSSEDED